MYATCLFCHRGLGRNALLPPFPVGRRLAFDPARGRLWVVCERCHRWNLSPVEERWEAIEECERLFGETPLRVSTDNVGLAELPEGLTLVRVGPAPRREIAAWRYGRLLRRHLRRSPLAQAAGAAAASVARVGGVAMRRAARLLELPVPAYDAGTWLRVHLRPDRVLAVVPGPLDEPLSIRVRHLESAELIRPEAGEPWRIVVRHDDGAVLSLAGDAGLRAAGRLLSALNGSGADGEHVRAAVRKVEDAGDPDGFFARIAELALRTSWGRHPDAAVAAGSLLPAVASDAERVALYLTNRSFWGRGAIGSEPRTSLPRLPLVDRLALEMAANEDAERRALQGELALLEQAWRDAEEIAAIADALPSRRPPAGLAAPHPVLA
jgi:hypothetical protein